MNVRDDPAYIADRLRCYRTHPDPRTCDNVECRYNNNDLGIGKYCCVNNLLHDVEILLRKMGEGPKDVGHNRD